MQPVCTARKKQKPHPAADHDAIAVLGAMPDFRFLYPPAKKILKRLRSAVQSFSAKHNLAFDPDEGERAANAGRWEKYPT